MILVFAELYASLAFCLGLLAAFRFAWPMADFHSPQVKVGTHN